MDQPAHPPDPDALPLGPRQRALLAALREANAELSCQALHERLSQSSQRHGLATVYRHLRRLQRSGLVRCRKLPNGESVYAPLERDDHHLICVSCGRSEPLPICPVGTGGLGLTQVLLQGFKPLFHTFEIHGLCRSCQQREPLAHG
ncbi:MAG: transcriptional repressor [Cyanobacteria bacterium M_DeepCast_200m_mx_001]|nr:transcriptional repressor [Cyanobacteria bacterium M_DeepCast_200m_mx_001]